VRDDVRKVDIDKTIADDLKHASQNLMHFYQSTFGAIWHAASTKVVKIHLCVEKSWFRSQ